MSDKLKSSLIKYGTSAIFALLIAFLHISLNKGFADMELTEKLRVLSDAFTIPGVLLIMAGALVWVTNQGTLYGVGYITSMGLKILIPGKGLEMTEKYADYVERKRSKKISGYGFLFVSGGITLAVGIVFMFLFFFIG